MAAPFPRRARRTRWPRLLSSVRVACAGARSSARSSARSCDGGGPTCGARARDDGMDAFCTKPERPPHASRAPRRSAGMAEDIKGCEGLRRGVQRGTRLKTKDPEKPKDSPKMGTWLAGLPRSARAKRRLCGCSSSGSSWRSAFRSCRPSCGARRDKSAADSAASRGGTASRRRSAKSRSSIPRATRRSFCAVPKSTWRARASSIRANARVSARGAGARWINAARSGFARHRTNGEYVRGWQKTRTPSRPLREHRPRGSTRLQIRRAARPTEGDRARRGGRGATALVRAMPFHDAHAPGRGPVRDGLRRRRWPRPDPTGRGSCGRRAADGAPSSDKG